MDRTKSFLREAAGLGAILIVLGAVLGTLTGYGLATGTLAGAALFVVAFGVAFLVNLIG